MSARTDGNVRVVWGGLDREIGAMLPHTMDVVDEMLVECPSVLPRRSDTGEYAAVWIGRQRGADGRACGALLVLGDA